MDSRYPRSTEQGFRHETPARQPYNNPANKGVNREQANNATSVPVQELKPDEERLKLVAYGSKAAFQVESSITKDGQKTVAIESAQKNDMNNSNAKSYNWKAKIKFQVTLDELPLFVAVLLGLTPAVRFDNHGDENKFLEITNQGGNFFLKLGGKSGLHVAPLPVVLAYQFGMVGLNEYVKNFPSLNSETVLLSIRLMVKQMSDNNLIKQPTNNQQR